MRPSPAAVLLVWTLGLRLILSVRVPLRLHGIPLTLKRGGHPAASTSSTPSSTQSPPPPSTVSSSLALPLEEEDEALCWWGPLFSPEEVLLPSQYNYDCCPHRSTGLRPSARPTSLPHLPLEQQAAAEGQIKMEGPPLGAPHLPLLRTRSLHLVSAAAKAQMAWVRANSPRAFILPSPTNGRASRPVAFLEQARQRMEEGMSRAEAWAHRARARVTQATNDMMQLDANNELFGEVLKVLNNISPTCQTVLKFMDKASPSTARSDQFLGLLKKLGGEVLRATGGQPLGRPRTDLADPEALPQATLRLIRILSNGNLVLIDGTSDVVERREMWSATIPSFIDALEERKKSQPQSAQALFEHTEAFMYRVSSKSIIKAILGGDAILYNKYVDEMIKNYPRYDNGLSHIYRGAFYLAAPWPIKSTKKAYQHFKDALDVAPESMRNNYFLGVALHAREQYSEAIPFFQKASSPDTSAATSQSEQDCEVYIREESKRALQACKSKLSAA